MSYDKEKLLRFQNAVLSEAENKISDMKAEIQEFEKAELEKARQEEYDKMFTYMQNQVRAIQWKYKQQITKTQLDAKRKLLQYRTNLAGKVFEQAAQKLKAFANSSEYPAFLLSHITESSKTFPCDGAVVMIRPEDMPLADQIIQATGGKSTVQADKKNHLGGYKIVNNKSGLLIDETFASDLADQHQYFYKQCGMTATV